MSTNYYWNPTNAVQADDEAILHIGLTAGGFSFMFQAYGPLSDPDALAMLPDGITSVRSWDDWKSVLSHGGTIQDDYGREVALNELIQLVEHYFAPSSLFNGRPVRSHTNALRVDPYYADDSAVHDTEKCWNDKQGYSFTLTRFS